MYFRKYEFPSEEYFDLLVQDIPLESNQAIVKLGKLATEELTIEELTAKKYCVDILWENEIPVDWTQYETWDVEENGSHTFLGWEFGKDINSNSKFENYSKPTPTPVEEIVDIIPLIQVDRPVVDVVVE